MSDPPPPDGPGEAGQPPPEQMRHQQISARVPEHVAAGVFSTGALVITGASEFVLDFVLRAMRPHQIVARVVLPHPVMPQFLRVLEENIERYEQRFGAIPSLAALRSGGSSSGAAPTPAPEAGSTPAEPAPAEPADDSAGGVAPDAARESEPEAATGDAPGSGSTSSRSPSPSPSPVSPPANEQIVSPEAPPQNPPAGPAPNQPSSPSSSGSPSPASTPSPQEPRRPSVEEIYGELKLPDELLSGVYANAVMISHSPGTFSFDFITSFYPRSAVAARVFLPTVYVPPLLDSMKGNWQHLQHRHQQTQRRRRDRDA